MLCLKHTPRSHRRPLPQQHHRAVHPLGVLPGIRTTKRHQSPKYYTSRPTPPSPARNRPLKLEVRDCVGAVVSPLLANVYAHYVLDLWAHQWRTRHAHGDVIIVRWADDFVVGFEHREDAERFWSELRDRLARFGLELNAEKTRLIEFGRNAARDRKARGLGKPETFQFLGFTHICATTRKSGRFKLKRITD